MFARTAFRSIAPLRQTVRSYATDAPSTGSGLLPWFAGGAALGAGYFGYTYATGSAAPPSKADVKNVVDKAKEKVSDKPAPKAFLGGDQDFLDLKLASVEDVNKNTKRFRFDLPEKDQVSGLEIACK